jgi:beta-phosphoglucomutase-like phosphatase (HAD superfamily)
MTTLSNGNNAGLVFNFDLDDCLVKSEHRALTTAHRYYAQEVAPELGLPQPGDLETFIKEHPGMTFRGIVSENCRRNGIQISEEQLARFAVEEKNRIIDNFGTQGLDATPGTQEALDYLTQQNIAHPIVTSSAYDRALVSIEAAKLEQYFERNKVFSAQGHTYQGDPKPDPGIYHHAFKHYDEASVFIAEEDSKSGATAAFRSGAFVIGNVGALRTVEAQVDRMKLLLDIGASIVLNNNESLIRLVDHLREYQDPYSRERVEAYLAKGSFLPSFVASEGREGRTVWLSRRIY